MTTTPRILITPRVESQAYASTVTAHATHPAVLAELADDAAGGHPSQRATLTRTTGGTFAFYYTRSAARHLVVRASVSAKGTYNPAHAVTIALTFDDGAGHTVAASPQIPDGLTATASLTPVTGSASLARANTVAHYEWVLSVTAIAAVLVGGNDWRIDAVVTCGGTTYLEHFQIEELPRWLVDDAETYGQVPGVYLPRGLVVDGDPLGLQRIGATLREAYFNGLRCYHAMARPTSSPWSTSSTTYATLDHDLEPGTGPIVHVMRPRRMRGATECRVRARLRYRTVAMGAPGDKAFVRLHTGSASSPFTASLSNTSGAWTDATVLVGYLKTTSADRLEALHWQAKVDSGSVELCTRYVLDYPV